MSFPLGRLQRRAHSDPATSVAFTSRNFSSFMTPTRILIGRIWPYLSLTLAPALFAQGVPLTGGGIYTQNFDTLPSATGISWVNDSTLPGWTAQTDATPSPLPLNVYNGGGAAV